MSCAHKTVAYLFNIMWTQRLWKKKDRDMCKCFMWERGRKRHEIKKLMCVREKGEIKGRCMHLIGTKKEIWGGIWRQTLSSCQHIPCDGTCIFVWLQHQQNICFLSHNVTAKFTNNIFSWTTQERISLTWLHFFDVYLRDLIIYSIISKRCFSLFSTLVAENMR